MPGRHRKRSRRRSLGRDFERAAESSDEEDIDSEAGYTSDESYEQNDEYSASSSASSSSSEDDYNDYNNKRRRRKEKRRRQLRDFPRYKCTEGDTNYHNKNFSIWREECLLMIARDEMDDPQATAGLWLAIGERGQLIMGDLGVRRIGDFRNNCDDYHDGDGNYEEGGALQDDDLTPARFDELRTAGQFPASNMIFMRLQATLCDTDEEAKVRAARKAKKEINELQQEKGDGIIAPYESLTRIKKIRKRFRDVHGEELIEFNENKAAEFTHLFSTHFANYASGDDYEADQKGSWVEWEDAIKAAWKDYKEQYEPILSMQASNRAKKKHRVKKMKQKKKEKEKGKRRQVKNKKQAKKQAAAVTSKRGGGGDANDGGGQQSATEKALFAKQKEQDAMISQMRDAIARLSGMIAKSIGEAKTERAQLRKDVAEACKKSKSSSSGQEARHGISWKGACQFCGETSHPGGYSAHPHHCPRRIEAAGDAPAQSVQYIRDDANGNRLPSSMHGYVHTGTGYIVQHGKANVAAGRHMLASQGQGRKFAGSLERYKTAAAIAPAHASAHANAAAAGVGGSVQDALAALAAAINSK